MNQPRQKELCVRRLAATLTWLRRGIHKVVQITTNVNRKSPMKRQSKQGAPGRDAPIQFRPSSELGQFITGFAEKHRLDVSESCKCLLALAATSMDCRFYDLVRQMADAMGGTSPFVRSCVHVHTALAGAERLRRAPFQDDSERALFILQTVRDYLATKGLQAREEGLWFLPPREKTTPIATGGPRIERAKRRVIKLGEEDRRRLKAADSEQTQEEQSRPPQREKPSQPLEGR
jgi:hypothetical protein